MIESALDAELVEKDEPQSEPKQEELSLSQEIEATLGK